MLLKQWQLSLITVFAWKINFENFVDVFFNIIRNYTQNQFYKQIYLELLVQTLCKAFSKHVVAFSLNPDQPRTLPLRINNIFFTNAYLLLNSHKRIFLLWNKSIFPIIVLISCNGWRLRQLKRNHIYLLLVVCLFAIISLNSHCQGKW